MFISMHTSGQDWLLWDSTQSLFGCLTSDFGELQNIKMLPCDANCFRSCVARRFSTWENAKRMLTSFLFGFFFLKWEILMAGDLKIQLQRGLPVRRSANFQAGLPLWIHPVALGPHPGVELQSSQAHLHPPLLWFKKAWFTCSRHWSSPGNFCFLWFKSF